MTEERRRFSRIPMDGTVRLHCGDVVHEVRLLDISLKGVLVERPEEWSGSPETACRLELLPGDGELVIEMAGTVVHTETNHLGIRWDHIDMDSAAHLRRLLELNLADEDLLGREIGELAG
ncbi:MAG TPA: PilZ domain-containing protein [Gammaproteobacteria bacterium]|nr:PilZ domain-containing protein [Gammaproteobacteria bacterium]